MPTSKLTRTPATSPLPGAPFAVAQKPLAQNTGVASRQTVKTFISPLRRQNATISLLDRGARWIFGEASSHPAAPNFAWAEAGAFPRPFQATQNWKDLTTLATAQGPDSSHQTLGDPSLERFVGMPTNALVAHESRVRQSSYSLALYFVEDPSRIVPWAFAGSVTGMLLGSLLTLKLLSLFSGTVFAGLIFMRRDVRSALLSANTSRVRTEKLERDAQISLFFKQAKKTVDHNDLAPELQKQIEDLETHLWDHSDQISSPDLEKFYNFLRLVPGNHPVLIEKLESLARLSHLPHKPDIVFFASDPQHSYSISEASQINTLQIFLLLTKEKFFEMNVEAQLAVLQTLNLPDILRLANKHPGLRENARGAIETLAAYLGADDVHYPIVDVVLEKYGLTKKIPRTLKGA